MRKALPLSLVLALPLALPAQNIPNGGFEEWTNQGDYPDPAGWLTSNMVSFSVDGTLTCEQGTPAPEGARYVMVSDRLLNGVNMQQGSITIGQWGVFPGFAFDQRPDALNGLWQYHPQNGGSDGVVSAALTRWNSTTHAREVIANAPAHALTPLTEWTAFSVPFVYYSDQDPDTAVVSIQATSGSPGDGTSIWVDDLDFGQLQSVHEEVAAVRISLWPSPAYDQLRITADEQLADVTVQDMSGRVMSRTVVHQNVTVLPVGALPAGMYLVGLRFADGRRAVRSFLKD